VKVSIRESSLNCEIYWPSFPFEVIWLPKFCYSLVSAGSKFWIWRPRYQLLLSAASDGVSHDPANGHSECCFQDCSISQRQNYIRPLCGVVIGPGENKHTHTHVRFWQNFYIRLWRSLAAGLKSIEVSVEVFDLSEAISGHEATGCFT